MHLTDNAQNNSISCPNPEGMTWALSIRIGRNFYGRFEAKYTATNKLQLILMESLQICSSKFRRIWGCKKVAADLRLYI